MDKKRIAIISVFVLVVLILGYAIYRLFFTAEKEPEGIVLPSGEIIQPGEFPPSLIAELIRSGQLEPGALPPSAARPGETFRAVTDVAEREVKIVESNIIGATVDKNGNAQFYNENDGKFYRMNSDGTLQLLSDKIFYNVSNVTWSPNNDESIIEYPDGSNIYFNFQTGSQTTLPQHWEEFSFSNDGDRLASKSIALSTENKWLITSNPDGKNVQFIEPMGENADRVTVDWSPTKKVVALSRTGQSLGADRQEIILVGLNGENFKPLTVEGRGLTSQWSPTGQQLLYSVYNERSDFKPELWIANADGDNIDTNRRPISLNTWAEKCAFANERYVYCGVPAQLDTGAGFDPSIADGTPDQIYKIDLRSGIKTIIETNGNHVIDKMFVNEDGSKIHFTDKSEQGLFSIDI